MSEYVWREPAAIASAGKASSKQSKTGRSSAENTKNHRLPRALAVIVPVLAALALVLAYIYFWIPFTEVKIVRVSGVVSLSESEIILWMGVPAKTNIFKLDAKKVSLSIKGNPRVLEAAVSKRFPSTLLVAIVERTALALVYARDGQGRISAHCVDSRGVVFAAPSAALGRDRLPILSGIEIRGLRYGMRLDQKLQPLLDSLDKLSKDNGILLSGVSELRVVDRAGLGIEVLMYPVNYRIPVRLGVNFDSDLMKTVLLVLDVVEARGLSPNILELDFRNDTFVYRTKEAVPG